MSYLNNQDGTPILEHHDELTLQWFHNSPQARQIIHGISAIQDEQRRPFRRMADRSANVEDVYSMIDELLPKFQMYFIPSTKNAWLLNFPFMFISPSINDKIKNLSTNETYTVRYVPLDSNNEFQGSVLLNEGLSAPKTEDRLMFENVEGIGPDKRKLVNFHRSQPQRAAKGVSEVAADTRILQSEQFTPTIVAELRRQEPGTVGKRPFDIAKEIKPRIREILAHPDDPLNYSIQVRGQWMDNIVRFICYDISSRRTEKLIAWFKDFIHKYTWILKKNGIQEILYWQRRADENVKTWRDDIVAFPIEYFFRTEELHIEVVHNLRNITLNVSNDTGMNPQAETGIDVAGGVVIGPFGETFATLFDATHDNSGNFLYGDTNIGE